MISKNPQHKIVGMTTKETSLAQEYIEKATNVLEWGSGGSTYYYPSLISGKYVSIEHNLGWYDRVKPHIDPNVEYYYVPIHPARLDRDLDGAAHVLFKDDPDKTIDERGIVHRQSRIGKDWHVGIDYIQKPTTLDYIYDVVFVDGRFRQFCAYVARNVLSEDGVVMVHDFRDRYYYHGILNYYDVVDKVDTLVVLKPKPWLNPKKR